MGWLQKVGSGIAIGLATVIPGLSAGTVALVLGIYRVFVYEIAHFKVRPMILLILGWFLGVVFGVQVVRLGLQIIPEAMYALFLGMVLVTVLEFYRRQPLSGWQLAGALVALGTIWFLVPHDPLSAVVATGRGVPWVLLAGVVSGGTLVLPGISGATVLILFGMYEHVIEMAAAWEWTGLVVFAVGALLGLWVMTRVMDRAFRRYEAWTLALLTGLMAGSVRPMIPPAGDVLSLVFLVFGVVASYIFWRQHRIKGGGTSNAW